jgi:hypothetical protein
LESGRTASEISNGGLQRSHSGSCPRISAFSSWNINNNTAGQALIIQDISKFKGGVDLGHAATAWQIIAYELTVGSMTVGQAVTQGNQTMQQLGDPERWTVIGDNSVKIAN